MTHLLLVRHGESIQNTGQNIVLKYPDHYVYLTDKGKGQAKMAGEFLKRYLSDKVTDINKECRMWISPYRRTRQTAERINDSLHIESVREDDMLIEMQFGLFDGISKDQVSECFPLENANFRNTRKFNGKVFARRPGGESPLDVIIRQRIFLDTLFRDINAGTCPEYVIIVGHGAQLTCLRKAIFHYSHEWYENEPNPGNCSIQHIILDNKDNKDCGYIYGEPMAEHK